MTASPVLGSLSITVTATLLFWKVIGATIVFTQAGVQVLLASRFWGVSGFPPVSQESAARLHRMNGRVAVSLAVVVAVVCILGPAGPISPTRVLLHSILGMLVFAVLATKFTLLRVLRRGERFLPYIGTALFLTFGAIWLTSVADFAASR